MAKKSNKYRYYAVVPAAGVGSRVGANRPKQYIEIAGKTVLEHTLKRLLAANIFQEIIVAVSAKDNFWQQIELLKHEKITVVEGGLQRSESVLSALKSMTVAADDWILVHDIARPCIKVSTVIKLINSLKDDDVGGLLALPVSDTVKRVQDNVISSTLDRSTLWCAQTPQMFRYGLLTKALEQGLANGLLMTDEAGAIELLGLKPKVVKGLASNIKITQPEDIALAHYYLSAEQHLMPGQII